MSAPVDLAGAGTVLPVPVAGRDRKRDRKLDRGLFASLGLCPLVVGFFLATLLVPVEASFYLGSFRLTPYRLLLIGLFFPAVGRLLSGRVGRLLPSDILMLGTFLWAMLSLSIRQDPGVGLESGGVLLLEGFGGYLVGRTFVRNARDFKGFAAVHVVVAIALVVVAVPEALTGKRFLHAALGGPLTSAQDMRMGLHRASGPFEHPILFGVFCASAVGSAFYAFSRKVRLTVPRLFRTLLVMTTAFFSLSSGAVATMMAQIVPTAWDLGTKGLVRRWLIFFLIFVTGWGAVDIISNRTPLKVGLTYLTLNETTGYYRTIIFEEGMKDVAAHPILGIGYGDWSRKSWMSASMDNFWLVIAVQFGVPAFLMLATAVLHLMFRAVRNMKRATQDLPMRKAWMISLTGLCLAGATVHYWNAIFVFFCFFVGAGGWMAARRPAERPAVSFVPVRVAGGEEEE